MFHRALGVRDAGQAAAAIERAAPLCAAAAVDDAPPLIRHDRDRLPPWVGAAVGAGTAITPQPSKNQFLRRGAERAAVGIGACANAIVGAPHVSVRSARRVILVMGEPRLAARRS